MWLDQLLNDIIPDYHHQQDKWMFSICEMLESGHSAEVIFQMQTLIWFFRHSDKWIGLQRRAEEFSPLKKMWFKNLRTDNRTGERLRVKVWDVLTSTQSHFSLWGPYLKVERRSFVQRVLVYTPFHPNLNFQKKDPKPLLYLRLWFSCLYTYFSATIAFGYIYLNLFFIIFIYIFPVFLAIFVGFIFFRYFVTLYWLIFLQFFNQIRNCEIPVGATSR